MSEPLEFEAFVKAIMGEIRRSARRAADAVFLAVPDLLKGSPPEVFEQAAYMGLSSVDEGVRAALAKYPFQPDVLDVFVQVGQEAFADRIALLCDGGPGGNA